MKDVNTEHIIVNTDPSEGDAIRLTIAIPTYRRAKYLEQAIHSALTQNNVRLNYEIIIVNNDPNDQMEDLKQKYGNDARIRFFTNEKNLGMRGNMNRCLELARGEYIAYLHDDDLLLSDYISTVQEIVLNGDLVCVVPQRYLFFAGPLSGELVVAERRKKIKNFAASLVFPRYFHERVIVEVGLRDCVRSWMNCYGAPTCGTLFKRETVLKYGLFLPKSDYAWDFYSFIALNEHEKIYFLRMPVAVYRTTSGASLNDDVQGEFYDTSTFLMEKSLTEHIEDKFTLKYENEIRYLSYKRLHSNGKRFVCENRENVQTHCGSKIKYYVLLFRRVWYSAAHNLDIEIPLSKKGRKLLSETVSV